MAVDGHRNAIASDYVAAGRGAGDRDDGLAGLGSVDHVIGGDVVHADRAFFGHRVQRKAQLAWHRGVTRRVGLTYLDGVLTFNRFRRIGIPSVTTVSAVFDGRAVFQVANCVTAIIGQAVAGTVTGVVIQRDARCGRCNRIYKLLIFGAHTFSKSSGIRVSTVIKVFSKLVVTGCSCIWSQWGKLVNTLRNPQQPNKPVPVTTFTAFCTSRRLFN